MWGFMASKELTETRSKTLRGWDGNELPRKLQIVAQVSARKYICLILLSQSHDPCPFWWARIQGF